MRHTKTLLVTTALLGSLMLGGVTNDDPFIKSITVQASETKQEEITEINVNYPQGQSAEYSYGTDFNDIDFMSYFNFTDQNGNPIPHEQLNTSLYFSNYSTEDYGFSPNYHNQQFSKPSPLGNVYYLMPRATLKSNSNIQLKINPNGMYSGIGFTPINQAPTISVLNPNYTVYENSPYSEYENITFSDYEDNRDSLALQTKVDYPSLFNRDSMQPGTYSIKYTVYDSQQGYNYVSEQLTVIPAPYPELSAKTLNFKASNNEFDPINQMGIDAIDALDGNITNNVIVLSNDVNLRQEGIYEVILQVENSHKKKIEQTYSVNVTAENPTLNAESLSIDYGGEFNPLTDLKYAAFDEVDGDLKDHVEIVENNVTSNIPGKYKVILSVENSNGKITVQTIFVTVNEKPKEPEIEVPEIEVPEIEEPEIEEPEIEIPKPEVVEPEIVIPEVPETISPEISPERDKELVAEKTSDTVKTPQTQGKTSANESPEKTQEKLAQLNTKDSNPWLSLSTLLMTLGSSILYKFRK